MYRKDEAIVQVNSKCNKEKSRLDDPKESRNQLSNLYVSYMEKTSAEKTMDDPITVEEAMANPERQDWMRAMQEKIHSLQRNNT